jgi:hypothetical protein
MTLWDLLFIAAVLATVGTAFTVLVLLVTRRADSARRLAIGWLSIAAAYAILALAVDAVASQRIIRESQPWCFDDWCLTVSGVASAARADGSAYTVSMRISSTARRISQRAAGAWIYVVDAEGRRYAPDSTAGAPLDALLGPGESVDLQRTFVLPSGIEPVGLITGHGGPYCGAMSWLIVGGGGCLFGKPTMIRLNP